jgi:hypothetical protein
MSAGSRESEALCGERELRGAGVNVVVYDRSDWHRFLMPALVPNCTRVFANEKDTPSESVAKCAECQVLVMHIDLTHSGHIPRRRSQFVGMMQQRGTTVINAALTNISKRHLHQVLRKSGMPCLRASRRGDPHELLIVKTDLNYGGESEREMPRSARPAASCPMRANSIVAAAGYPVLRRREVRARWWDDERLVIERYVTNRRNHIHRGHVVGDRLIVSRLTDDRQLKRILPDVKSANTFVEVTAAGPRIVRVTGQPACSAIVSLLTRTILAASIDFGAIDIVESDEGELFVIDINSTPVWGGPDEDKPLLRFLAEGLPAGALDARPYVGKRARVLLGHERARRRA